MNPFQALLDDYHNNRDKQEYQKFIEEERRRHGHHLQGRGVGEWRPFLVAPRRAATAGRGGGRPHELRCWPGATTEDASGPCRGPLVFSFDHAIHRPFCASPSPRQPSTAWTPSPPPAVPSSPSVFAWSTGSPALSMSSTPPSAPSLVPVSTRPRPLLLPALSPAPAKAAAATTAEAAAAVAAVATTVTPAEEESTDALLSLVTLSCTSSPAASPRPTSRLLRPERLAELRKRKRDAANDEPAGPQLVDQDERQPLRDDDDGDGADQEEDRRPRLRRFGSAVGRHKRRRVDMTAVGVDACTEAAIDRGEQEEGQQGAEDSDVERDYSVDNNDDDDDDDDDDDQAEDGEHGIRVMTLGEESANEDETDEHRQQHQHQKVMETETAATSCIAARRGPRRIWGWISARELESLKLYKPMAGCRRTRVARMGLHHLNINRPHTGNNTV